MHESIKKSSKKKVKLFLKPKDNPSAKISSNILEETEYKEKDKNNQNDNLFLEKNINNQNKILHEKNIKEIELLQQQLNELEKKNKLIEKEKIILKNKQKDLEENFDILNKELQKEKAELNELKEANQAKNREYIRLQDIKNRHMNNNNRNNNNSNDNNAERNQDNNNTSINNSENSENENDRFGDIFNGLNFLLNISRLRRAYEEENDESRLHSNNLEEENNEEDPGMTNEQLQALESSIYPRNNNSDEKCTICEFVFCYNDTVIKLKCNHIFHKDCLINRLSARHSSKCPTCKDSII